MKLISLLFVGAVLIYASTMDDALNAFKAKEYKKAMKLYAQEAEQNNSKAQNALSYLYFNGLGTQKDVEKGRYWLTQAALQADSVAQYDMAMMYLGGYNFDQDYKQALFWLERSSDLGNRDAQYNLALMYYQGDGVDINVTKTALYLEQSAKQGHQKAKQLVGRIYMQILDFDKAIEWLNINADEGDAEAIYLLSEIYCSKGNYSESQKYKERAIELNYPEAESLTCKEALDNKASEKSK